MRMQFFSGVDSNGNPTRGIARPTANNAHSEYISPNGTPGYGYFNTEAIDALWDAWGGGARKPLVVTLQGESVHLQTLDDSPFESGDYRKGFEEHLQENQKNTEPQLYLINNNNSHWTALLIVNNFTIDGRPTNLVVYLDSKGTGHEPMLPNIDRALQGVYGNKITYANIPHPNQQQRSCCGLHACLNAIALTEAINTEDFFGTAEALLRSGSNIDRLHQNAVPIIYGNKGWQNTERSIVWQVFEAHAEKVGLNGLQVGAQTEIKQEFLQGVEKLSEEIDDVDYLFGLDSKLQAIHDNFNLPSEKGNFLQNVKNLINLSKGEEFDGRTQLKEQNLQELCAIKRSVDEGKNAQFIKALTQAILNAIGNELAKQPHEVPKITTHIPPSLAPSHVGRSLGILGAIADRYPLRAAPTSARGHAPGKPGEGALDDIRAQQQALLDRFARNKKRQASAEHTASHSAAALEKAQIKYDLISTLVTLGQTSAFDMRQLKLALGNVFKDFYGENGEQYFINDVMSIINNNNAGQAVDSMFGSLRRFDAVPLGQDSVTQTYARMARAIIDAVQEAVVPREQELPKFSQQKTEMASAKEHFVHQVQGLGNEYKSSIGQPVFLELLTECLGKIYDNRYQERTAKIKSDLPFANTEGKSALTRQLHKLQEGRGQFINAIQLLLTSEGTELGLDLADTVFASIDPIGTKIGQFYTALGKNIAGAIAYVANHDDVMLSDHGFTPIGFDMGALDVELGGASFVASGKNSSSPPPFVMDSAISGSSFNIPMKSSLYQESPDSSVHGLHNPSISPVVIPIVDDLSISSIPARVRSNSSDTVEEMASSPGKIEGREFEEDVILTPQSKATPKEQGTDSSFPDLRLTHLRKRDFSGSDNSGEWYSAPFGTEHDIGSPWQGSPISSRYDVDSLAGFTTSLTPPQTAVLRHPGSPFLVKPVPSVNLVTPPPPITPPSAVLGEDEVLKDDTSPFILTLAERDSAAVSMASYSVPPVKATSVPLAEGHQSVTSPLFPSPSPALIAGAGYKEDEALHSSPLMKENGIPFSLDVPPLVPPLFPSPFSVKSTTYSPALRVDTGYKEGRAPYSVLPVKATSVPLAEGHQSVTSPLFPSLPPVKNTTSSTVLRGDAGRTNRKDIIPPIVPVAKKREILSPLHQPTRSVNRGTPVLHPALPKKRRVDRPVTDENAKPYSQNIIIDHYIMEGLHGMGSFKPAASAAAFVSPPSTPLRRTSTIPSQVSCDTAFTQAVSYLHSGVKLNDSEQKIVRLVRNFIETQNSPVNARPHEYAGIGVEIKGCLVEKSASGNGINKGDKITAIYVDTGMMQILGLGSSDAIEKQPNDLYRVDFSKLQSTIGVDNTEIVMNKTLRGLPNTKAIIDIERADGTIAKTYEINRRLIRERDDGNLASFSKLSEVTKPSLELQRLTNTIQTELKVAKAAARQ